MLLPFLASLFLTTPAPLEMPQAEGRLISDGGYRIEDRFVALDLWTSRAVIGRWRDDEGREFMLSRLVWLPPLVEPLDVFTRCAYSANQVAIDRRDLPQVRQALERLTELELAERAKPPRQRIRRYADVDYWQGTNATTIVCAFRPQHSKFWFSAIWNLLPEDDFEEAVRTFEDEFLGEEFFELDAKLLQRDIEWRKMSEREQLREDARSSVAAYEKWHVTDGEEFSILDDLLDHRQFVVALTNDLTEMRKRYAAVIPPACDASNTLSTVRIFASREEYLDAIDGAAAWSAAYWSPARREIVAHLGDDGNEARLLRTMRHEAFHQYLAYATAMIPVSPWINEGYAQYFEDESSRKWNDLQAMPTKDGLKTLAKALPNFLKLDEAGFYCEDASARTVNYWLAWSIAVFLEDADGAGAVAFEPFKDLKKNYFKMLMSSQDREFATEIVFNAEMMKKFQEEWIKFWSNR